MGGPKPTLSYGSTPVPYTVAWSAEESFFLGRCDFSRQRAVCQASAPGEGKPNFGKPHMQRQREVIAKDLCDLCGKTLKNRTKVSLSHARTRMNGAEGACVMQVEPLLHKECAAISMRHCPSLKRDVGNGTIFIRQVTRHRVQFAVMDPTYVGTFTGEAAKAVGHAKVELQNWRERDEAWLLRGDP